MTFRATVSNGELATTQFRKGNEIGHWLSNTDQELSEKWRCDLWHRLRFVTVAHGCQLVNTGRRPGQPPNPPFRRRWSTGVQLPSTEGCSCASACRLSPIAIAADAAYPHRPA